MSKKPKINKEKKPRKDPRIQEVYEQDVEFVCPVRGKVVQKVKIKKYKTAMEQNGRHILIGKESLDDIEKTDDGLSIYDDGEELGVTGEET